jgi:hypothetical protein
VSLRRSEYLRLLDQSQIDLKALASQSGETEMVDLEALIGLARKLPSGFVHADALWLIASAPEDLEPLAPGSNWYAVGRELLVVVRSGERWNAVEILTTVHAYYVAARHVYAQLKDDHHLFEALLGGDDLSSELCTQCALKLDAPINFFQRIETESPELKFDLGWMARREFCPVVHVHASLRPQVGKRRGEEGVQRLFQALPECPIRLILSDHDGIFDPVSPYVRDLAGPICQWARENKSKISTPELHEKLDQSDVGQSVELATLVIPDLMGLGGDLLREKRTNEAQAGLHFVCDGALKIAWASVESLSGADSFVIESDPRKDKEERLVVVSSASEETLLSVARALLATGRVSSAAGVFSLEGAHMPGIISTSCIVGVDDGVRLDGQGRFLAKARDAGVEIEQLQRIELDTGPKFNLTAFRLASLVNRQQLVQGIDGRSSEPSCLIGFYRRHPNPDENPLQLSLARSEAHRLGLAALLSAPRTAKSSSNYPKHKSFRV